MFYLILGAASVVMGTNILLSILDSSRLQLSHIWVHASLAVLFFAIGSAFLIRRTIRATTNIFLFSTITGFILTLFCDWTHPAGTLIFFSFPLIAHELSGARAGWRWSASFFILSLASYFGLISGILPLQYQPLPMEQILVFASAYVFITAIIQAGERQQERYLSDTVRKILYDETTQLPNRHVLVQSLSCDREYLFAIIHIENFSDLGVLFGYELSDIILQSVAVDLVRWGEILGYTAYRLKGNEFGILFQSEPSTFPAVSDPIDALCSLFHHYRLTWEERELGIGVKIGAVVVGPDEYGEMLSRADIALKTGIKSHHEVTFFNQNEHFRENIEHSVDILNNLLFNITRDRFKAYFQPIVCSRKGDIVWYECLLRIESLDGKFHSPLPYLPVAKSAGLDRNFTHFMIREACRMVTESGKYVSVNLSFNDIMRNDIIEVIEKHYTSVNRGEGTLILEILEHEELTEMQICREFIDKVHELGCLIAIDDFGSGYSNFINLIRLPVDIVKIDGTLIQQITDSENARDLIQGITDFCKRSGKQVVAEYVDSHEIAHFLRSIEVDFLQGFLFGHPQENPFSTMEPVSIC